MPHYKTPQSRKQIHILTQQTSGVTPLLLSLIIVSVYEIPSGRVLTAFSGHLKVVYDLCWSNDDHSLLSASSDGTVK